MFDGDRAIDSLSVADVSGNPSERPSAFSDEIVDTTPANANSFLQVAALSSQSSAAELQRELEGQLNMPTRVVDGGGLYRVQVGTTPDAVSGFRRQLSDMGYDEAFPVSS
ncbi:SPOR domain-containing protein [Halomonas sp. 5021]|jgi:adhesin transport system outer membrane protein|uniref:SPOR domain-containing protein n=1 Tax=unclassified Halomonas TaxID=2609666 RepID=UPI0018F02FE5|nr:SPOR domain-containing protein [Halomonas sp. A40-4]QPL47194.1 SPOR domain-containing protein [Halomonas sp. A40-4]